MGDFTILLINTKLFSANLPFKSANSLLITSNFCIYFDLFDSKSLIKLSFSVFKEIKFDFLSKYCNSGTAPNLTRFSYFSRIEFCKSILLFNEINPFFEFFINSSNSSLREVS